MNETGRRYPVQNRYSVSKGVEVLIRVNNDIHCVFLHLLEEESGSKSSKRTHRQRVSYVGDSRTFDAIRPK